MKAPQTKIKSFMLSKETLVTQEMILIFESSQRMIKNLAHIK